MRLAVAENSILKWKKQLNAKNFGTDGRSEDFIVISLLLLEFSSNQIFSLQLIKIHSFLEVLH